MKSVWRNRDFVWLVSGQTLSEFGAAIGNFAIPWLLLQITGSAMQMGLSFAVGFIPYLVLSLPAGAWADRWNRKTMMMWSDASRLLLVSSIPVVYHLGELHVWLLYVVQAGLSASSAFFDAGYGASVPAVVGRHQLKQANGILQSGWSSSQILAPALAGSIVSFLGAPNTILITGITYIISVVSLLLIRTPFSVPGPKDVKKGSMVQEIREGLEFVWNHKLIRVLGIFGTVANIMIPALYVSLLFRMQHDLHLSSKLAGIVLAGWGLGSLIGASLNGRITKRMSTNNVLIAVMITQLIPPFVFIYAHSWPVFLAIYTVEGMALAIWNVNVITMRQALIPDHLMGRAMTSIRLVSWAGLPVGNSVGGSLVQMFGSSVVFALIALGRVGVLIRGTALFKGQASEFKQSEAA